MKAIIVNSLIAATIFGVMDSIWFAVFMKNFAIARIGSHMELVGSGIKVNYLSVLIAYLFMIVISTVFLAPKVVTSESLHNALINGLIMGVCVFGIFDFTNRSLMKSYPLDFSVIDTLWGGLMFAVVASFLWKFGFDS